MNTQTHKIVELINKFATNYIFRVFSFQITFFLNFGFAIFQYFLGHWNNSSLSDEMCQAK